MDAQAHVFDVISGYAPRWTPERLDFYTNLLFENVDLQDKRMLDIGGGDGTYSFCATALGCREVVNLEPASDGAHSDILNDYETLRSRLDADITQRVSIRSESFQEYEPEHDFDIILSHCSINHLDEEACKEVHVDQQARETFIELGRKMYHVLEPGGELIVADASRHNFFGDFDISHPLGLHIDWEIHQSPETWRSVFEEAGFDYVDKGWASPTSLGELGYRLFGNWLGAYFFTSQFKLLMRRGMARDM